MFGTFNIHSTLEAASYRSDASIRPPPGSALLPDRLADIATLSLAPGAAAGAESEWEGRWFSTLADTLDNSLRVNLGLGVPSARIIEERAANARAEIEAGRTARVARAAYDPRSDPTRVSLGLEPAAEPAAGAGRPAAWARKELFVLNRDGTPGEEDGRPAYCCSETVQEVDLGPQAVRGAPPPPPPPPRRPRGPRRP